MRIMVKVISFAISLLILGAWITNPILADDTYPYSYSISDMHTNGRLIVSSGHDKPVSILIKPKWEEESEVFYLWNGIERKNARGISLGNSRLLAADYYNKDLILIRRDISRIVVALSDTLGASLEEKDLPGEFNEVENYSAQWVGRFDDTTLILKINNYLYGIFLDNNRNLDAKLISVSCISVSINRKMNFSNLIYIESAEGTGTVITDDLKSVRKPLARINIAENQQIFCLEKNIALTSSAGDNANSLIYLISGSGGIIDNFWIESNGSTIAISGTDKKFNIYYITYSGSNYYLNIDGYSAGKRIPETSAALPREIIGPELLKQSGQYLYALFRNGFLKFDRSGETVSADFLPISEYISGAPDMKIIENNIIISTQASSLVLKSSENSFWWFFSFMRQSGKIIIPLILVIIILVMLQLYRRQKRLLRAVLNLPSSGAVLVLDKNGRLYRANSSGMALAGITGNLPMGKPLQFYFTKDNAKPVKELLEKALEMKNTVTQKVNIAENSESREWYCIIVPLRTTAGFFTGLLFTGIDITEELERKRLSNWAQLAHDMQTNLSTIKLNAEQLGIGEEDENTDRKRKIIHQVNILMHRVRDVVTVGRSDGLDRQLVNGADICAEVKAEFDDTLFPNVRIITEVQNTMVSCDRAKLTRTLRNAVENAIRALEGKDGIITLSNRTDARYAYFSVKDTGKGMDAETSKKMLKPYFTTSKKYGGMGMGTMIMQHVAELHGGKIEVVSEKGKGSEIIFSFPNFQNKRK